MQNSCWCNENDVKHLWDMLTKALTLRPYNENGKSTLVVELGHTDYELLLERPVARHDDYYLEVRKKTKFVKPLDIIGVVCYNALQRNGSGHGYPVILLPCRADNRCKPD